MSYTGSRAFNVILLLLMENIYRRQDALDHPIEWADFEHAYALFMRYFLRGLSDVLNSVSD